MVFQNFFQTQQSGPEGTVQANFLNPCKDYIKLEIAAF